MRTFSLFPLAAGLLTTVNLFAVDATNDMALRKVAIIVENRAGAQFNDKVTVLEDLLSSRIAGKGYSIISRGVTINALKSYDTAGVAVTSQTALNASGGGASAHNSTAALLGQADSAQTAAINGTAANDATTNSAALDLARKDSAQIADSQTSADSASGHSSAALDLSRSGSAQVAVTPETTKLDQALSDNTSALRLAQNLGADFILIPAITTYGTEKKTYTGDGIATINVIHKLRVSYKMAEADTGGEIKGGTVIATKTIRQSGSLQVDDTDVINELLDDAADQLADIIAQNASSLPAVVAKNQMVTFNIACSMTDPRQQPILVPTPDISADNTVIVTNPPVAVQPLEVTVELDGIALGSAPGSFQAYPGLHKLRLSREGFDVWERTINVYDGQTLHVALQMSAAGYAGWADTTSFLASLNNKRKLTDAEAERIRGLAKFYSESHYRVDATNNTVNYYNGHHQLEPQIEPP
jgi:PEGA domain